MEATIAGQEVHVNQEGYLTDFSEWNKDIAKQLAEKEGITLTPEHWKVIEYVQDKFKKNEPISIRSVKNSWVIDIKELYRLFPGGPLKKATLIAGVPKPTSCI
ncbi:MAG: TusE/DsrC/DsvC family sulfur relay protein [Robiginitalea sp.]